MSIHILTSNEKKRILESLSERFGISEIPQLLLRFGKGKIRGFSGSLSRNEISRLVRNVRVELIGLYILREESDAYRISHDGLFVFKNAEKNVVDIPDEQAEKWLKGQDIETNLEEGWVLLKNKNDLIGCGKVKNGKILNFVPKERRVF